ncbi:MAG: YybH family protein [Terriglobia bacterium]
MAKRVVVGLLLLGLLGLSGQSLARPRPDKPGKRDKEAEKIEQVVAGLIAAYRAGDYDAMERYYAPEVIMVSFLHEVPLVGWARIRQAYQLRDSGQQNVELLREDTRIERRGKLAWVYYRWSFVGRVGNQLVTTLGHTTLILEKRGRRWLIVHNHSSPVPSPDRPAGPRPLPAPPES